MIIERQKRGAGIMGFLLSLVIVLASCKSGPTTKTPTLAVTSPISGNVTATGDAQTPAKVESAQSETTSPLPAHSEVSFIPASETEPAKTVVKLAAPSVARTVTKSENITAPRAFTPPAPPTPNELATAAGIRWFYIAGALFAVAALALVYFQHYKAAGCAALGAFLVPTLANLLSHQSALVAAVALGVASCVLFIAWFLAKSKLTGSLNS